MLRWVDHEKSFITLGSDATKCVVKWTCPNFRSPIVRLKDLPICSVNMVLKCFSSLFQVFPLLIHSLQFEDIDLQLSTMLTLVDLIQNAPELVHKQMDSLIPKLLKLTTYKPSMVGTMFSPHSYSDKYGWANCADTWSKTRYTFKRGKQLYQNGFCIPAEKGSTLKGKNFFKGA